MKIKNIKDTRDGKMGMANGKGKGSGKERRRGIWRWEGMLKRRTGRIPRYPSICY